MSAKVWGNFLVHEKLDPSKMSDADALDIVRLVSELAKLHTEPSPYKTYADRLWCRRIVCETAIALGIDLTRIKHPVRRQAVLMGRGLLDIWNTVYADKFGSAHGTGGERETIRRNIVTKLSREE